MLFEFKLKAIIHKNTPNIHEKCQTFGLAAFTEEKILEAVWRFQAGLLVFLQKGAPRCEPAFKVATWVSGGGDQSYRESFFN